MWPDHFPGFASGMEWSESVVKWLYAEESAVLWEHCWPQLLPYLCPQQVLAWLWLFVSKGPFPRFCLQIVPFSFVPELLVAPLSLLLPRGVSAKTTEFGPSSWPQRTFSFGALFYRRLLACGGSDSTQLASRCCIGMVLGLEFYLLLRLPSYQLFPTFVPLLHQFLSVQLLLLSRGSRTEGGTALWCINQV